MKRAIYLFLASAALCAVGRAASACEGSEALAGRLRDHVTTIASTPHNTAHPEHLENAARAIENALSAEGYGVETQVYDTHGQDVRNIWVTIPAAVETPETQTLVVGAHYDSAGEAPGANDNGSGAAIVLELARALKDHRPKSTRLHLVLFVNEEPPWFRSDWMGSKRFAELLAERKERVGGMISLETIGYFSSEPDSQHYPAALGGLYPTTGDFLAFAATPDSGELMEVAQAAFKRNCDVPTVAGTAPWGMDGVTWSDHVSFAERKIPAIMITDTAIYRYPHYHKPTDTPDKIDYEKLARITTGIAATVRELAR